MRVALDTNVLVYAEGFDDTARQDQSRRVLAASSVDWVIPVQVLGELFNMLTRKMRLPADVARGRVQSWCDTAEQVSTSSGLMVRALDLAATHRLQIWDAVVLTAAVEAGCRALLSEDMQDGFTWQGTTIVNPFATRPHRLLASLLRPA